MNQQLAEVKAQNRMMQINVEHASDYISKQKQKQRETNLRLSDIQHKYDELKQRFHSSLEVTTAGLNLVSPFPSLNGMQRVMKVVAFIFVHMTICFARSNPVQSCVINIVRW